LVSRTDYLFGCVRCSVQPEKAPDGKTPDAAWFDFDQITVVKENVHAGIPVKSRAQTGGPMTPAPARAIDPRR